MPSPCCATALPLSMWQDAGYFDQAHLTRSLKHFTGQTPVQIVRGQEQLSLLYNTDRD